MKEGNIVKEKSFVFAVRIINLYKYLIKEKREFVVSKQILKSGTSIGANIEEAIGAFSKKDFISKISISYKETRETLYWLKLLRETKFIKNDAFISINSDCQEICKILAKTLITSRK